MDAVTKNKKESHQAEDTVEDTPTRNQKEYLFYLNEPMKDTANLKPTPNKILD